MPLPTLVAVGFEELELAKAVGEGSFGQVYLAKYCHTIGRQALTTLHQC